MEMKEGSVVKMVMIKLMKIKMIQHQSQMDGVLKSTCVRGEREGERVFCGSYIEIGYVNDT